MSVTATAAETLKGVLNQANPNKIADALAKVQLGTLLAPTIKTFTAITAAAAHDITDAAHGYCLPILAVVNCRVTAVGTGALGARVMSDVGGTPGAPGANGPGIATLSADGKTITFEGTVTGFVLTYVPQSTADVTAAFVRS
jgi:hypothetical protein